MYLGVHVSISGNISEAVDRASALKCTAMQIFSRNPRQWRQLELSKEDAALFKRKLKASHIGAVAVHIPYLINLATPYGVLYQKSIQAYIEDMQEAAALTAPYLVTHMGSYKNSTYGAGLKQFCNALNTIFAETNDLNVRLLLENTAGSGHWLGSDFSDHKFIFDHVKEPKRLGVCLDTAHLFAAGRDIRQPEVFDSVLAGIENNLGPDALQLIHLNDSKADCGSLADRHEHIGKGFIGLKALGHIVNHPKLKNTAFILETPKDTPRADRTNLNRVRKLIESTN